MRNLVDICPEKEQNNDNDAHGTEKLKPAIPKIKDPRHEHSGQHHVAVHGKTIRCSQVLGLFEQQHDKQHRSKQKPIHRTDINLRADLGRSIMNLNNGMMLVMIPWYTMENMPLIMACDAITVARILKMRNGIYNIGA